MTLVTLVTGPSARAREAAIAAALPPGQSCAVILEGLADGAGALSGPDDAPIAPRVLRIAPGCLCCSGNLVLRVTLNRLMRQPPARLFISLADATHIERLRRWLTQAPYRALLQVDADMRT